MSRSDKHYIALLLLLSFLTCCVVTDLDANDAAIAAEAKQVAVETVRPAPPLAQPQETPVMLDTPLTGEEVQALLDCCEAGSIDPSLALGLIYTESRFEPDAVSPSGCYGYCQLNPQYFPADLAPADNIRAGVNYLAELLDRYDDLEAALTAYRYGHDTGDRTYAKAVLKAAEEWRDQL